MPNSASTASTKRDLYADVTAKLIATIERDPSDPQLPWRRHAGKPLFLPENALTKNRYRGVNIVSLWAAAEHAGYAAPIWGTYRQWRELGCQVRKGEKASIVVFYKAYEVEPDPDNDQDDGRRRVARASYVFNCAQVDGYQLPAQPDPLPPIERLANADRFFAAINADVRHGGDRAYYNRADDYIQMPDEALFTGTATMTRTEGYYATLGHEQIHRSGADNRLNRNFGKRFGDDAYVAEELVALSGQSGRGLSRQFPRLTPCSDADTEAMVSRR
jgi:antirestriction protein ArdC